jgi:GGDEF domain-containing protein
LAAGFDRNEAAPAVDEASLPAHLESLASESIRRGATFSVLLLALDGLAPGDPIRRPMGAALADEFRSSLRASDVVLQRSDDTLVIVLPGAAGRASSMVADRLRRTAGSLDFRPTLHTTAVASLSIGLAEFSTKGYSTAEQMMAAAAEALAAVQSEGGNAVRLAGSA